MAKEMSPKFQPQEVEAGKYNGGLNRESSIQTKIQMQNLIQSLFHHQM